MRIMAIEPASSSACPAVYSALVGQVASVVVRGFRLLLDPLRRIHDTPDSHTEFLCNYYGLSAEKFQFGKQT